MIDISVSIVSTNEHHYIKELLPTLYQAAAGLKMEVILLDNASTDELEKVAKPEFTNLKIIRNKERLGFCSNHNIGIEASKGRYILVLNPDILFEEGERCLTKMVNFMDEHTQCGVSGCRVYHFEKDYAFPARRFFNPRIVLARRLPSFFHSNDVLDQYFYKEYDIHDTFECDWLSGCFLLFRNNVVKEIGGFDQDFRKYFEDTDICYRVGKSGWQVLFHGATFYYHLEQRASKKIFSKDAILHFGSYLRWLKKTKLYFPIINTHH